MAKHQWGTDTPPVVYNRRYGAYHMPIIESMNEGKKNFAAFLNGKPVWVGDRGAKEVTFEMVEQAVFIALKQEAEAVLGSERRGQ